MVIKRRKWTIKGGVTISIELVNKLDEMVNTLEEINNTGLRNLMVDYNLTWKAVYNIVKESIEEVQEEWIKDFKASMMILLLLIPKKTLSIIWMVHCLLLDQ